MTTVRRESLAEQAAELLFSRVRSGEWSVGDKLPGETTLALQLGVGRSTAREAIRILAGRGILATRQGAGVFVTATRDAAGWNAAVQRADIIAVIEARTAIEVEAAALAAERRTDRDIVALRRTLADRDQHRAELADLVDADLSFHRSIVAAAQSPILLELFDGFAPRSRQAMVDMLRLAGHHGDEPDQIVHAKIIAAIEAGHATEAAMLTREHLRALVNQLT